MILKYFLNEFGFFPRKFGKMCFVLCISEAIKAFLTEFCETNENGAKFFKYASQLVNIAHREQVSEISHNFNQLKFVMDTIQRTKDV